MGDEEEQQQPPPSGGCQYRSWTVFVCDGIIREHALALET